MFANKTLAELNAEKPLEDVYFDYDKADLRDEARASLSKNAEWLKRWPSTKVARRGALRRARHERIQPRARREARGRRPQTYLVGLGIAADRIQAVSKGEESPFCTEETESCWTQNRRGHFILSAK